MEDNTKLSTRLWEIVQEYTRRVADLMDCSHKDCHWIGTDDNGNGIFSVCDFGDTTFLTLEQMQVIIDRLPEWEARYGSREAVAQEVYDWLEWSLEEENLTDGHPRINLEHWLMGCPREKPESGNAEKVEQLRALLKMENIVLGAMGDCLLSEAKAKTQELIDIFGAQAAKEMEEDWQRIRQTQAYKDFEKLINQSKNNGHENNY